MLILFLVALRNIVFPAVLGLMLEPLLLIVIIVLGICMALGCIGLKFDGSCAAVVNQLFKGIGWCCRPILKAAWRLGKRIAKSVPGLFERLKSFSMRKGQTKFKASILAGMVTIIYVIILI